MKTEKIAVAKFLGDRATENISVLRRMKRNFQRYGSTKSYMSMSIHRVNHPLILKTL